MPERKRLFIGFAVEDSTFRDFMRGQARNDACPFDFIDMSAKQPWDTAWKTNCRIRIKGCDGMIALVSKNTLQAEGARWEIKTAIEEGIPVLGVYVNEQSANVLIPELAGQRVVRWNWEAIKAFINSL